MARVFLVSLPSLTLQVFLLLHVSSLHVGRQTRKQLVEKHQDIEASDLGVGCRHDRLQS